MEVQRFKMADSAARKQTKVPFSGKVVEQSSASGFKSGFVLCLGDNDGKGPTIFLVCEPGVQNMRRADGNFSWLVPPVPAGARRRGGGGRAVPCAAAEADRARL